MKNRLTVLGSPRPAKTRRCRHFLNCVNPTFNAFTGLSHPEQLFITALFLQHVDDQGVLSLQRIYWDGGTRLNNLHKSRIEQKDVHHFGPTNSIKLGRKWAPLSLSFWWCGELGTLEFSHKMEEHGQGNQWDAKLNEGYPSPWLTMARNVCIRLHMYHVYPCPLICIIIVSSIDIVTNKMSTKCIHIDMYKNWYV